MIYALALITVPVAVLSFFLGFYSNLLIRLVVDLLNVLQKLNFTEETRQRQEVLTNQVTSQQAGRATFVEPQTRADMEAQIEMERIAKLNNR